MFNHLQLLGSYLPKPAVSMPHFGNHCPSTVTPIDSVAAPFTFISLVVMLLSSEVGTVPFFHLPLCLARNMAHIKTFSKYFFSEWINEWMIVKWFGNKLAYKAYLNYSASLAGMAQWTECRPMKWKVTSSILSQHMPAKQARSPFGDVRGSMYLSLTHTSVFPSLPSFPISKNK